jgi:tetratricopeptide (TPR) repeat protein
MKRRSDNKCTDSEIGNLISRYEMGKLTSDEWERFEEHLMECSFCQSEVEVMLPVVAAIRTNQAEILSGLHNEGISYATCKTELCAESHKQSFVSRFSVLVSDIMDSILRPRIWAPSLAVVAVCLFFLLRPAQHEVQSPFLPKLSFNKLIYQPIETRGESMTEGKRHFDEGMSLYVHGDYESAIKSLRKAVKVSPDNDKFWLYLGVTYYLEHKPELAVDALTHADTLASSSFKTRTGWYRAQAYLLAGDSSRAVPLLDRVIHEQREYANEADTLLTRIRSTVASK